MSKGVTHAHLGPIWYHLELSDILYSLNQFLALDFFWLFLQQDCSSCYDKKIVSWKRKSMWKWYNSRKTLPPLWLVLTFCMTFIHMSLLCYWLWCVWIFMSLVIGGVIYYFCVCKQGSIDYQVLPKLFT